MQKTAADEANKIESDVMIFEDDNIKITYNFWAERGDGTFYIYNKTQKTIYIDLAESFLVVNGTANPYFKNRAFSTSASGTAIIGSNYTSGTISSYGTPGAIITNDSSIKNSQSVISSNSSTVTVYESRIAAIPSKSGRYVSGFELSNTLIRKCELLRAPRKEKQIKTSSYQLGDSPMVIENRVSYGFDEASNESNVLVNNIFWVSEITNYPSNMFFFYQSREFCDNKYFSTTKYCKYDSPNSFYIRYTVASSGLTH